MYYEQQHIHYARSAQIVTECGVEAFSTRLPVDRCWCGVLIQPAVSESPILIRGLLIRLSDLERLFHPWSPGGLVKTLGILSCGGIPF